MSDVLIERVFRAPRELVFRAWTDPEILMRWYAPHGCTYEILRMDLREGGTMHSCVHHPEFGDCWTIGTFLDIAPPAKLRFSLSFSNEKGEFCTPEQVGRTGDWPSETWVTVTFEEVPDGTRVTLHQTLDADFAERMGALPGWRMMLDRLEGELAR